MVKHTPLAALVGESIGQALDSFFDGTLTLLGALTLVGGIMEHYGKKPSWLTKWRVRDLPAFGLADPAAWGMAMGSGARTAQNGVKAAAKASAERPRVWGRVQTPPAAEALWSLIGGGIFVLWWIGALHIPGLNDFGMRGGDVVVSAAPIWSVLFAPILAWAVAGIAVDATGLIWPYAVRLRALLKIPLAAAGLWLGGRLFQAGQWFTLTRGDQTARVEGGPTNVSFEALRAVNEARARRDRDRHDPVDGAELGSGRADAGTGARHPAADVAGGDDQGLIRSGAVMSENRETRRRRGIMLRAWKTPATVWIRRPATGPS